MCSRVIENNIDAQIEINQVAEVIKKKKRKRKELLEKQKTNKSKKEKEKENRVGGLDL